MTYPTPPVELLKRWEDDWFEERQNVDVLLIEAFQAGYSQCNAEYERASFDLCPPPDFESDDSDDPKGPKSPHYDR